MTNPPPPLFYLRGHVSPVTYLTFIHKSQSNSDNNDSKKLPFDSHFNNLNEDKDSIISCSIKNDTILASGASDGKINLWNLETRRPVLTILPMNNTNTNIADPDSVLALHSMSDFTFISQYRCGLIKYRSLMSSTEISTIETNSYTFCKCAILSHHFSHPYASILMLASNIEDDKFDLYDRRQNSPVINFPSEPGGMVTSLSLITENDNIYAINGRDGGTVSIYDIKSQKNISSLSLEPHPILSLESSGNTLYCGTAEDTLSSVLFSNNTLTLSHKYTLKNSGVSDISVRCDKKIFATAGWDGILRIFSCKSFQPLALLNYHNNSVNSIDFADYGTYFGTLAGASSDGRISIVNIYS